MFFSPLNNREKRFDNSADAFAYEMQNLCNISDCNIVINNVNYIDSPPYYDIRANYKAYNNEGEVIATGTTGVVGESQIAPLVENTTLKQKIPAGEPTLDPDPYLTAAILDRWAHIVPEMRKRVSDYVDFVPSKAIYTEKDVLGNVLKTMKAFLSQWKNPLLTRTKQPNALRQRLSRPRD